MWGIIAAIVMFCILIVFHEGGHFLMAKAVGIKVNEFAIGMGPMFFKKQVGETLYSFRAFPIGGFCAMESSEGEEEVLSRTFEAAKVSHRAMVLFAGPLMNFLVAVLIMVTISFYVGTPSQIIGQFSDDSMAKAAGLEKGDKIVSIDGKDVGSWTDVGNIISESKRERVDIEIERNGIIQNFAVNLITEKDSGRKMIGIMPKMVHNPGKAAVNGGIYDRNVRKAFHARSEPERTYRSGRNYRSGWKHYELRAYIFGTVCRANQYKPRDCKFITVSCT